MVDELSVVPSLPRVPRIAEYILGNPNDYTFSSLVGAVDGLPPLRAGR